MLDFLKNFLQSHTDNHSEIVGLLKVQQTQLVQIQTKLDTTMAALDSLNTAIASLIATTDNVVTTLNTPHPTEAQVQAAADVINSQVQRLNLALGVSAAAPSAPGAAIPPGGTGVSGFSGSGYGVSGFSGSGHGVSGFSGGSGYSGQSGL